MTVATVVDVFRAGTTLGEGPVWSPRFGAVFFTDIKDTVIHRLDWAGGQLERFEAPETVGSLVVRSDGLLLAACRTGWATLQLDDGFAIVRSHTADPEPELPGNRFNDGAPDRQGRFWAGTMDDAQQRRTGSLYRLDPDGTVTTFASGIGVPNGLAFSPDGTRMYFADSLDRTIWSYDYDPGTGAASNRRVFARVDGPGAPDGSTVDEAGCVWNAEWGSGRLVRYAPTGAVIGTTELSVRRPTRAVFAGPDLDHLVVTTAMSAHDEPDAGSVLVLDVGVRGLADAEHPVAS